MLGDGNPFEALTLIVAPAILTNASSVLVLGTANRYGRAVDRLRALRSQPGGGGASDGAEARVRAGELAPPGTACC